MVGLLFGRIGFLFVLMCWDLMVCYGGMVLVVVLILIESEFDYEYFG